MNSRGVQTVRRPARYNTLAVCLPVAGLACAAAVGFGGQGVVWVGHPGDGVFWGFRVWFGSGATGLLAALAAASRGERPWPVTALGVALNLLALGLGGLFLGGR